MVGGLLAVLIVVILVVLILCVIIKQSSWEEPQKDKKIGPVYEDVSPALPPREKDIGLQSNQAYGQVTRVHK